MPIYEYYCGSCQDRFQLLRPLRKADEPAECPRCHQASTQRKISTFACINKGSDGGASSSSGGGCASCSGGSCSTCGH